MMNQPSGFGAPAVLPPHPAGPGLAEGVYGPVEMVTDSQLLVPTFKVGAPKGSSVACPKIISGDARKANNTNDIFINLIFIFRISKFIITPRI